MSTTMPLRTIVLLSYWGTDEPLTLASVVPTVHMLIASGLADRVVLCTVERAGRPVPPPLSMPGCVHVQWGATALGPRPLARAIDLLRLHVRVVRVVREHRPLLIMARGVVAGGYAHFASKATGVPYAVDYFEPHADYMADVGEWRRGGPLYRGLSWLMRLQRRSALRIVTVARNYREMLLADGVDPARVLVAPCPVDLERMRSDPMARAMVRREARLGDGLVGIYLGKFGGLYHRERSYAAFARYLELAGQASRMVVLTPEPVEVVLNGLREAGADLERVHVAYAPHGEVPAWLSAADVAFAPYRGTPSSACISPMKIGEYWAAGLPVLLTRGVGDDSAIIAGDPDAGALFDPEGDDLDDALRAVLARIGPEQRVRTQALAARHRSMRTTEEVYREIMAALPAGQRNQANSA
jgi:glycosyltransferase involved in cell wall biosynthesis